MVFQGMSRWALHTGALTLALLLGGCTLPALVAQRAPDVPPPAPREFRAAWVATVANIDWPSRPGLDSTQQQAEIRAILDTAQRLKLNAIVLQVRPSADAIYPSALEPWSEYLSGTQGQAPQPLYDPLEMWVREAHARGLELHAWLNPYRVRQARAKSALAPNNIANTHPQAVKSYGDLLWMDPAEPVAVQRTLDVVRDVVRRYDVDGIHIDDYFYPYPLEGADKTEMDFPDEPAWLRYVAAGGQSGRADWRRQQVNSLVQAMHQTIQQEKPWVRFGISPFGLGRPDRRPPGIQGFSQYDKLYADAELWLKEGWLDYFAPQLYWPIDQAPQAFGVLLDTWVKENSAGRHIWPGLYTSRIDNSAKTWAPQEIDNQIQRVRMQPGSTGHIHFSMVALLQDRAGISQRLKDGLYAQEALVPATPWLGNGAPAAPELQRETGAAGTTPRLTVKLPADARAATPVMLAVWKQFGTTWHFSRQVLPSDGTPAAISLVPDPALGTPAAVTVSAVSRLGVESARTKWVQGQ
ncbi:MAG: family 10 glycosylhydrolase [Rhodoferax sp.]|nr:family 10 glycosylhydrolase [Rhodoferax sp.]